MHWCTQYIGLPWSRAGTGPDSYNCWEFARFISSKHFGITLPDIEYATSGRDSIRDIHEEYNSGSWVEIDQPVESCIILMGRGSRITHIGICILVSDVPHVLHCVEGLGVICQKIHANTSFNWSILKFFRSKC